MKKFILILTLGVFSLPAFSANPLEGDYACKIGFLRVFNTDSLSIQSGPSGSLIIHMNDDQYQINPRCQVQGHSEIKSQCSEEGRVTLVKTENGNKTKVVTTVTFEKIRSMVIVKESINNGHGNSLTVYVCRPL